MPLRNRRAQQGGKTRRSAGRNRGYKGRAPSAGKSAWRMILLIELGAPVAATGQAAFESSPHTTPSAQPLRHLNKMAGLVHGSVSRQGYSAGLLVSQAAIKSRQYAAQVYNSEI